MPVEFYEISHNGALSCFIDSLVNLRNIIPRSLEVRGGKGKVRVLLNILNSCFFKPKGILAYSTIFGLLRISGIFTFDVLIMSI